MSVASSLPLPEWAQNAETDEDGKRDGSVEGLINQGKLSELVREIGRPVSDPRALLQRMANLGQIEILRQAGLLEKGGSGSNLDLTEIQKAMFNQRESFVPPATAGAAGKPWQPPQHPVQQPPASASKAEALAGPQRIQVEPVKLDSKIFEEPLGKLEKTIRDQSPLEIVKIISEAVLRIEQQLQHGIMTMDVNELMGDVSHRAKNGAKSAYHFGAGLFGRAKKSFADLSLRDLAQRQAMSQSVG